MIQYHNIYYRYMITKIILFSFIFILTCVIIFVIFNSNRKINSDDQQNHQQDIELFSHKLNIPIYYINLDRSYERKQHIENQFKIYNIKNYKRISAIDGNNISKSCQKLGINYYNNYKITNNEIACTLSHLYTIRQAYYDNHDMVLIVEDDVSFDLLPKWNNSITNIINSFPVNWYCVSLFNQACYIDENLPEYINIKDKICSGSVAYIINRKGMKYILNGMDDILIMDRHDKQNSTILTNRSGIADVFIFNRIKNCYQKKIPLFFTSNNNNNLDSTIHTDHTWRHKIISKEIQKIYNSKN